VSNRSHEPSGARFGARASDPSFVDIDQNHLQYETSRPTAIYHHWVLGRCARLAGLESGMSVLDYGCGSQHLRGRLPDGVEYTGYDLVPRLSTTADPLSRRYDCVFAIQVMMYIDADGLREWVTAFAERTPLVVAMVPERSFLKDRVLDHFFGLDAERERLIRSQPAEIDEHLSRCFRRTAARHALGFGRIGRWERH